MSNVKLTREPEPMHAGGSVAYRVTMDGRWIGWVGDARPWRGWRFGQSYWWSCWREEGDTAARWNTTEPLGSRKSAIEALVNQVEQKGSKMSEERLTTEAAIREWLLRYAWMGTEEEQAREVDCIMAQGEVASIVDGLTERFAGMANDDSQRLEAHEFALSSMYECHDGPHLETCPHYKPQADTE